MLLSFSVTNYLSFKNKETISFLANADSNQRDFYIESHGKYDILKMAGIFGANASGKSNLIGALTHLRTLVTDDNQKKEDKINRPAFAFDDISKDEPSIFEISFFNQVRFDYLIEFNDDQIIRESLYFYKPRKALVFLRKVNEEGVSEIEFGSKINYKAEAVEALKSYLIRNRSVIAAIGKVEIDNKELELARYGLVFFIFLKDNSTRNMALYLLEGNPKLKETVIEHLKRADYNIDNFDVKKMEYPPEFIENIGEQNESMKKFLSPKKIYFQHLVKIFNDQKEYVLNENLESSGTMAYFYYAVILSYFQKSGGILIIDELESSLHPELIEFFIDSFMLNTTNSQLIFTSHYLPILEDQEDIRKDVVWFTNKREDGSTELYSLKDFKIRSELNFYRAYKVGKFSAKPILGSVIVPVKKD
ncbi:MAG: ATP-binding protein [Pedobacter sp.]|jgi:hypothetical protein